jgi:hypothetical protein
LNKNVFFQNFRFTFFSVFVSESSNLLKLKI